MPIRWNDSAGTVTIGPRVGAFPGMPSSIEFRIVLVEVNRGTGFETAEPSNSEVSFRGPRLTVQLREYKSTR